jgi:hypothetical protein
MARSIIFFAVRLPMERWASHCSMAPEAGHPLRFSLRDDVAVIQLLDETRKAVHAVRIDAGFGGAGKHFSAGIGGFCRDTAPAVLD